MSEISLDAIEELEGILDKKASSTANDGGTARVTRVDADGTAWVHVFGGAGETPLRAYGSALAPGDVVEVRQAANGLYSAGNYSDPAAGVQYVRAVEGIARDAGASAASAVEGAAAARQVADEAQKVAEATNQHFFADDNGAHITDVTQDEWSAAVDDNFSDYDPDTKPYHNQLLNSLGILLRTALNNLVSITKSAIAFYDGTGNAASNIVARFGADGAQVGMTDESHMELDYHSLQLIDKEGDTYFHVSDLRDDTGEATITEQGYTVTQGNTYRVALPVESVVSATYVDMQLTVASIDGNAITFEQTMYPGREMTVVYTTTDARAKAYTLGMNRGGNIGPASMAEGIGNVASGVASHAEGQGTSASGSYSHAEGQVSYAEGNHSHAEGHECGALGSVSHAEGMSSHATGYASHAEGTNTEASGDYSHAQNSNTIAASDAQTAMGKYNEEDANDTYALIIGNGTGNKARSNALAVTWDGDVYGGNGLSCTPVMLFDDDAQALSGAVTLAETAANFSRLVICYRSNDGDYGSAEVWHPDGKTVSLIAARTAGGGTVNVYLKSKTVLISGTTIDTVSYQSGGTYYATSQARVDGNNAAQRGDYIAITQVIGYR